MQEEIWKEIKGYEGIYQVSSEGRVKSLERDIVDKNGRKRHLQERIKEYLPYENREYSVVTLSKDAHCDTRYVDYLVADAFIPNPECHFLVGHKNKIKTDNRVDNLEWISCDRPVGYYSDITGKLIKTFPTVAEAAQYTGDSMFHVGYLAQRNPGIWRYVEDKNE